MSGSSAVVSYYLMGLTPRNAVIERNRLIKGEYALVCILCSEVADYLSVGKLNCVRLVEINVLEFLVFVKL